MKITRNGDITTIESKTFEIKINNCHEKKVYESDIESCCIQIHDLINKIEMLEGLPKKKV